MKRAGLDRIEQARDKVFGKLPQRSEDDEMLVGGDVTINYPVQPQAEPNSQPKAKKPGLLSKVLPLVATAALTAAGMWWAPAVISMIRGEPDNPQAVDTDTITVPKLGWGPERE